MMRGHALAKSAALLIFYLVITACFYAGPLPRPGNPPEGFQERDVVGVWRADYGAYDWRLCGLREKMREARQLEEWLVLKEDKTFHQILRDRRGERPDQEVKGTWHTERLPDGVTRLHLEGGIFFANEVCYHFPNPPTLSGWVSYSADQTGHELLFKQDEEAIMIVGWDKSKLYLEYPFVGNPDAPIIVRFERVLELEVDVSLTPGP